MLFITLILTICLIQVIILALDALAGYWLHSSRGVTLCSTVRVSGLACLLLGILFATW
jgi:hypothetical protein